MSHRIGTGQQLARVWIVFAVCASYFAYVFRAADGTVFHAGMGDWVDPYFINFLLEHWHHSLWTLSNPLSPAMYFPIRGTLGYSHGLILFAPFYVAVRPWLHPFQAYNATLFLVLTTGALSLYLVFKNFLKLSFIESLLFSAFFFTSANVIDAAAGIWSQRMSVFVIPPLLLLTVASARMAPGRRRSALAWLSGLGFGLLPTQDFYTAAFATLVSALFVVGAVPIAALSRADRCDRIAIWWKRDRDYLLAFGLGALGGCVVFVRIYLGVYRQHAAFPQDQLVRALTALHTSYFDLNRALGAYESLRSFELVLVVAVLACVPRFRVPQETRRCCLWFLFVSVIVLMIPLRLDRFSVWQSFVAPVPGFSSIRDPKRVIECYELAATLMAAWFLARLPIHSRPRTLVAVAAALLMAANWNRNVFSFERPINVYERWVARPIEVNPSCRSFFIKGASDAYMSRSFNQWGLYGMDSMFIAVRTSIPTLNGYSAWWPAEWRLSNPQNPDYAEEVSRWIARYGLRDVCALDIEARTMRPYLPPDAPR